jgi:molybdopterin converting factor small subunit
MNIDLQYFSGLRDLSGPPSIEVAEGSSVGHLLKELFRQVPDLAKWDKHLLIAAGEEYVSREYLLQPGDLISLMPPVQGG